MNWMVYPAVVGSVFGLGHFLVFYFSKLLITKLWFIEALKKIYIDLSPITC